MRRTIVSRFPRRLGTLPLGSCLYLLLACGPAAAADPPQTARYVIEQPAQGLAEALRSIARQTGTSVLFEPGSVAGRVASSVSGRLSPIEAITTALQGTGLRAELMADGAIVVKAAGTAVSLPPAPAASAPRLAPTSSALQPLGTDPQRIAAAGKVEAAGNEVAGARPAPEELSRVEVTGSRLKRIDAEGPAPVNVYTSRDIERSGQPNLGRFLAGLNEVSASSGEGTYASTIGQATVQLRGLPLGSTLLLINGRRVQAVGSSPANYFNLNLIPLAAVERVEVVPIGSSAVYGGDALAGVVNVILKKSVDGQSLVARMTTGRGFEDGSIALATGGRDNTGSYLVMGTYSHSTPLTVAERPLIADADFRRLGGTDQRRTNCTPGTVSSANGANLPGLGASVAAIPTVPAGQALTIADFQATAGQQNLCNLWTTGGGAPLLYGYETLALHATAEQQVFGSWSAFAELTLARERMQGKDVGLLLSSVLVPASNAFNPFGAAVRVTSALDPVNGTRDLARQTGFTRVLAGLKGELGAGWDAEVNLSTTQDRGSSQTGNDIRDAASLSAALASSTPATALNLFTSGRAASDDVLHRIWTDRLRHTLGRKDQAGGQLRGTLLELPAGPVEAVVGAELARDRYVISANAGSQSNESRTATSAYGELRAPLLRSAPENAPGWDLAALTLAGRRDRYSDFGSAGTYQVGMEFRPMRTWLIRASAADSFKPPTLLQTDITEATFDAALFGLVDPARGGERVSSGTVVRTTNRGLGPERGKARGIGMVWEPDGGLGTRFSATHWQMRIRGMISVLQPQSFLDYEALFPGFVIRGPSVNGQPGPVTSVRYAEVNVGRLDSAGTDLDAAYAWRTSLGKLTAAVGATRTNEYRVQLAPGVAVADRLGRRFDDFWSPQWKGRVSASLDAGAWNFGITSRYLGGYKDAGTSDRQLGDFWLHDLSGSLNLKKLWPQAVASFKGASAGLSVVNVANREPQYIAASPNFDITQADWRGRYVSLRLSLDW